MKCKNCETKKILAKGLCAKCYQTIHRGEYQKTYQREYQKNLARKNALKMREDQETAFMTQLLLDTWIRVYDYSEFFDYIGLNSNSKILYFFKWCNKNGHEIKYFQRRKSSKHPGIYFKIIQ